VLRFAIIIAGPQAVLILLWVMGIKTVATMLNDILDCIVIVINTFLAVFCAHMARTAFEAGHDTSGWLSLVASAGNAAIVLATVI